MINEMTLDEKFNELGIKPKNLSLGTQKIKCPVCQGTGGAHNPKDRPLALTLDADGGAVWFCHHCTMKGNYYVKDSYHFKRPRPQKTYVSPKPQIDPDKQFLYDFMKARGISKDTVDNYKLFASGSWIAFPYHDEKGELVNVKYRTEDKMFKQEQDAMPVLYNYENIHNCEEVIFVEGEMDALSLAEIGFNNVTTLPNGAPKAAKFDPNDQRFAALEHSPIAPKKVILFTDNDGPGRALHKELLHRFGRDIAWYVRLPKGVKDANELLVKQGPEALRVVVEEAIAYPIDGLYSTRDYFHALHDLYDGNYDRPFEVGAPALDKIYKIMPGTFNLWTGIPNHGKSMFLDFVLLKLAAKYKQKFAIFSPEQSTQMHLRRLVQMHTNKSFDPGFTNRLSKEELTDALAYIHKHFFFIETRDSVPKISLILDIAKSATQKFGVHGIIIDPYNEVDASRPGNQREDEHIRDFISICKRFARVHNSTVFCVAHPTKLQKGSDGQYSPPTAYDVSGAAHWHNQSDAIITVHRDFDANTTTVMTRKIREQGLYGEIGEAEFTYDITTRTYKERVYTPDEDWSTQRFNN